MGADKFDKFDWKYLPQTSNESKAVLALPKNVIFLSKNENAQKFEWFFVLQTFSENPTLLFGNLNENKHGVFGHIWLDKRGHWVCMYLFICLLTPLLKQVQTEDY